MLVTTDDVRREVRLLEEIAEYISMRPDKEELLAQANVLRERVKAMELAQENRFEAADVGRNAYPGLCRSDQLAPRRASTRMWSQNFFAFPRSSSAREVKSPWG